MVDKQESNADTRIQALVSNNFSYFFYLHCSTFPLVSCCREVDANGLWRGGKLMERRVNDMNLRTREQ